MGLGKVFQLTVTILFIGACSTNSVDRGPAATAKPEVATTEDEGGDKSPGLGDRLRDWKRKLSNRRYEVRPRDIEESVREHYSRVLAEQPPVDEYEKQQSAGDALQNCSAPTSEHIVIVFEGTLNYDPWTKAAFDRVRRELFSTALGDPEQRKVELEKLREILDSTTRAIAQAAALSGNQRRWSGLLTGALISGLEPYRLRHGWDYDSFHFPSEEFDLRLDAKNFDEMRKRLEDIALRIRSAGRNRSLNIERAFACWRSAKTTLVGEHKAPKLIVLGYSSGSRAAIKFMELLNERTSDRVAAAFLVDPVPEAHNVVAMELLPGLLYSIKRATKDYAWSKLPLTESGPSYAKRLLDYVWANPPSVKSVELNDPNRNLSDPRKGRYTRAGLYKPGNVDRLYSVYQNVDRTGLGLPVLPTIIGGSPIRDADRNLRIEDPIKDENGKVVEALGHGTIAYHPKTLELLWELLDQIPRETESTPAARPSL